MTCSASTSARCGKASVVSPICLARTHSALCGRLEVRSRWSRSARSRRALASTTSRHGCTGADREAVATQAAGRPRHRSRGVLGQG